MLRIIVIMSATRIATEAVAIILADDVFLSKLAEKLSDSVTAMFEKQLNHQKTIIQNLQLENNILRDKVDNLEQYSRRNCVRIFGVPEESTENTEAKVCDLIKSNLTIDIHPNLIDRCHRVGKPSKNARPIIVKFTSYKTRERIIKSRKLLKGTKISIKEDLTHSRYELYKFASTKFGFKNVWTRDGNVFVKTPNNEVVKVLNIDQCKKLN